MAILPDDEPPTLKRDGSRASDVSVEKVDEKAEARSLEASETESLDEVIVKAEDVAVKVRTLSAVRHCPLIYRLLLRSSLRKMTQRCLSSRSVWSSSEWVLARSVQFCPQSIRSSLRCVTSRNFVQNNR